MTPTIYATCSTRYLMEIQVVYLNAVRSKRNSWHWIAILLGRLDMIQAELATRVPKEFSDCIETLSTDNNLLKQ